MSVCINTIKEALAEFRNATIEELILRGANALYCQFQLLALCCSNVLKPKLENLTRRKHTKSSAQVY